MAVPTLADEAGPRSEWVVVNGMTAVDWEEMREESAEKRDGSAVVSNVRVPNGSPLVLCRMSNGAVWVVWVRTQVCRWG